MQPLQVAKRPHSLCFSGCWVMVTECFTSIYSAYIIHALWELSKKLVMDDQEVFVWPHDVVPLSSTPLYCRRAPHCFSNFRTNDSVMNDRSNMFLLQLLYLYGNWKWFSGYVHFFDWPGTDQRWVIMLCGIGVVGWFLLIFKLQQVGICWKLKLFNRTETETV